MTVIVTGDLARYRQIIYDGVVAWRFECPGCGTWAGIDDDQWHGRVSVDHSADGCTGAYHETHNYAADLEAHLPGEVA